MSNKEIKLIFCVLKVIGGCEWKKTPKAQTVHIYLKIHHGRILDISFKVCMPNKGFTKHNPIYCILRCRFKFRALSISPLLILNDPSKTLYLTKIIYITLKIIRLQVSWCLKDTTSCLRLHSQVKQTLLQNTMPLLTVPVNIWSNNLYRCRLTRV